MLKKIYLQLILSLSILLIILFTYFTYFRSDNEINVIEKNDNKILKDTPENLISDLLYHCLLYTSPSPRDTG